MGQGGKNMPQRTAQMLWALLGLVAVIAILLCGVNVYRWARTGPQWRRRLVTAGLFLLAALGLGGYLIHDRTDDAKAGVGNVATLPLGETASWKTVVHAWQMAAPFATSGKSTVAERKQVTEAFNEAQAAIGELVKTGRLVQDEADLLSLDADRVRAEVFRGPPTDSRESCYAMMTPSPARDSFARVSKRLPLLKKALQENRLAPEVVARILPTLEADLSVLASEDQLKQIQGEQRDKARAAGAEAGALLERLKARMKK
jgi:hypothetical protein